jgi:hypothetical protein
MRKFFRRLLFSVLCLRVLVSCDEGHTVPPVQLSEGERLTLNKNMRLQELNGVGIWYLYLSNYGSKEEIYLSEDTSRRVDFSHLEFELYDISFFGQDTLVFSYGTLLDGKAVIPNPKVDKQVMFLGDKVIGLGADRGFSFFSENLTYCEVLQSNFAMLSFDEKLQEQLKSLSNNHLELNGIISSSNCLANISVGK